MTGAFGHSVLRHPYLFITLQVVKNVTSISITNIMNKSLRMSYMGGNILKSFLIALFVLPAFKSEAKLDGSGFYRVQNFRTERYVYLRDNKSWVLPGSSDIELGAIELWRGFDMACSDPASVMYFESINGQWDIQAQGTGVFQFTDMYVKIYDNKDGDSTHDNTYYIYGTNSGLTKYLGDSRTNSTDQGVMSSSVTGDGRKWYITPITSDGSNYFGVKPTVSVGGKYYQPFYAAFPFSTKSAGMKVYYIKKVDRGMAVLEEINGVVPASTAVFIECSNADATNNRLNIGGNGSAVSGNMLDGVYFHNTTSQHRNLTPYDAKTMRVLGTMADGSLGFVTASIDNLPANQAYLKVAADSPAQLKVVTQAEYDAIIASTPTGITLNVTNKELTEGESFQLVPTVTPSTASGYTIEWTSSDSKIASVDSNGKVLALTPGTVTVTARINSSLAATCTVTVKRDTTPKGITLNVSSLELVEGSSYNLIATVTPDYATGYEIIWSSSNSDIVSVNNAGQLRALSVGTAVITARIGDKLSATCTVTVKPLVIPVESIALSATSVSLIEKTSVDITATPVPANATNFSPAWTSSDNNIAIVDNGVITGVTPGEAVITVTSGNVKAECHVTVLPIPEVHPDGITLDFNNIDLRKGETIKITAVVTPDNADNKTVTWMTTDNSVATVNTNGLVTAVGGGVATIIATTANGLTASCEVTVNVLIESLTLDLTSISITEGNTFFLTATILPADATNQELRWETSDTSIATVTDEGVVNVLSHGAVTITASTLDGSNLKATCHVNAQSGVDNILADVKTADVYTLQGVVIKRGADADFISHLQPGVYIIVTADTTTKIVVR